VLKGLGRELTAPLHRQYVADGTRGIGLSIFRTVLSVVNIYKQLSTTPVEGQCDVATKQWMKVASCTRDSPCCM